MQASEVGRDMIIDDIRARYPALSGALYFYEPGQPVTLEMIDAQGKSFSFTAPTVAEVIAQAFPELTPTEPEPETPAASVFD